jgi:hypothetical protein
MGVGGGYAKGAGLKPARIGEESLLKFPGEETEPREKRADPREKAVGQGFVHIAEVDARDELQNEFVGRLAAGDLGLVGEGA